MPETMTLHEALTAAKGRGAKVRPVSWRERGLRPAVVFRPPPEGGGGGRFVVRWADDGATASIFLSTADELLGPWEELT
jgi:hypothetical protein